MRVVFVALCLAFFSLAAEARSIDRNGLDGHPTYTGGRSSYTTIKAPGHPPIRFHAEESGRGQPLVLLHGLGASTYTFRKIAPALAQHYRVIAIDLKGHGQTDKPFDRNYSAYDQAVLIYWFLRQHGLKRVTLAGHSFGGQVALQLAVLLQRYDPHRIKRLILLDAPVYPQKFTPAVRLLRKPVLPYVLLTLMPRELPITLALMSEMVGIGDVAQQDIDIYAQPYADAGARHAIIQTARQIQPANVSRLIAKYRKVRQPTLLIWCRRDQTVPLRTGRRLARALPRARLKVLDRCNHIPPEQRPGTVVKLIERFMQ